MRYFFAPLIQARESINNTFRNIKLFARKEFHMNYGMRKLIELFYAAIRDNTKPDPISRAEILRTSYIMEAIFHNVPKSMTEK